MRGEIPKSLAFKGNQSLENESYLLVTRSKQSITAKEEGSRNEQNKAEIESSLRYRTLDPFQPSFDLII
jgi:hypothetical protein